MLRIGMVLSTPFLGSVGVAVRVQELAISLAKLNAEVHIFTPFEEKIKLGENIYIHQISNLIPHIGLINFSYNLIRQFFENVSVFRHFLLKRNIMMEVIKSFSKSVYESVNGVELDILQGEQEIAALACIQLSEKLKIPIVASLHNIWPEELVETNLIMKKSKQYQTLQRMEEQIITGADVVIVLSNEMKQYTQETYGINGKNVVVVPLGGRPRINKPEYSKNPSKVVYSGLVTHLDGVEILVKSISTVLRHYPQANFYITRRGEALRHIQRLAQKISVNPNYVWFAKRESFYRFLKLCHIGIVTSMKTKTRQFGYSLKFFDYLSVGLPVVANSIGGWTRIIRDEKVGILTEDNSESFAEGILQFLKNPEMRYEFGKRGLALIQTKFNWDFLAMQLYESYQKIV